MDWGFGLAELVVNQACHIGGSAHLLLFKYHLIEEGREGVHKKAQFRSQGGRGVWGGFDSAHVIFQQPPPQTKINTKKDRNYQIVSPFVDSIIQNGYDITWP